MSIRWQAPRTLFAIIHPSMGILELEYPCATRFLNFELGMTLHESSADLPESIVYHSFCAAFQTSPGQTIMAVSHIMGSCFQAVIENAGR